MPVLNEAKHLEEMLNHLQVFRENGHEVIVVDGGSTDSTIAVAKPLADHLVVSDAGRAKQMNSGVNVAECDVLLFLHADTILPEDACELILSSIKNGYQWGRFNVRLSGEKIVFRIIEFFINWRSKLFSIATGDQAIFVKRNVFEALEGFPDIPLMEDVAICKSLKRQSKPMCLRNTVTTSSRRWEQYGIFSTVLLMWRLRFLYFIGVSAERLVKHYK